MQMKEPAFAGTLESSDVLVEMIPGNKPLLIELESPVKAQFGDSILASVREVLAAHGVSSGTVKLNDHGALDCTIRARVETCLARSAKEKGGAS